MVCYLSETFPILPDRPCTPPRDVESMPLGLSRTYFKECDLQRLQDPQGQLNDVCIDGTSHLFHLLLLKMPTTQTAASRCTVFSTYIMCYIQDDA